MTEKKSAVTLFRSEIDATANEISANLTDIKEYDVEIFRLREKIRELEIINIEKKDWINSLESGISKLED